jgi:uncharacterized protein YdcH (DUF465 family)
MEAAHPGASQFDIEAKKKEKLALKDELYEILKKASSEA